ncbi:MAG TPA: hypothetical protein VFH51_17670, partial [Myxococcota bacterium]|nr:hypothetical protein [Myxococcota bacterium]
EQKRPTAAGATSSAAPPAPTPPLPPARPAFEHTAPPPSTRPLPRAAGRLPPELWGHIARYTSLPDFLRLRRVCVDANAGALDISLPAYGEMVLAKLTRCKTLPAILRLFDHPEVKRLAPQVRALRFAGARLDAAGVRAIAERLATQFPALEALTWHRIDISALPVKELAPLTSLRELRIRHVTIPSTDLVHLEALPQLETVELGSCGLGFGDIAAWPLLPNLTRMDLTDNWLTDEDFAGMLLLYPGLVELRAPANAMQGDSVYLLGLLTRLEELDLSRRPMGEEVESLALLPRLRTLKLTKCALTASCIETLAELPALETLNIGNNGLVAAAIQPLVDAPKLRRLVLNDNPLGAAAKSLCASLGHLEQVSTRNTA